MLGLIRFALALAVLLSHVPGFDWALNPGVVAVICFYCISGYLMRCSYQRFTRLAQTPVRDFIVDRVLKLFPQYLVVLAITVGLLALFDVPLSLANFFSVPILIGLGIDSNIHLLHRADENRHGDDPGFDDLAIDFGGTRSAVIFTSLTTAIGFGGQIFASHRGMQGLGWIMTIGSLVCLATSMWLLPAVLRLLREPRADRPRQGAAR